jgi:hypothetical protein
MLLSTALTHSRTLEHRAALEHSSSRTSQSGDSKKQHDETKRNETTHMSHRFGIFTFVWLLVLSTSDANNGKSGVGQRPEKEVLPAGNATFQGYGCAEAGTGLTRKLASSCTMESALCNERHPNIAPIELLTVVENRPYAGYDDRKAQARSFERWCHLPAAKGATGCAPSPVEFDPTSASASASASSVTAAAASFSSSLSTSAEPASAAGGLYDDPVPVLGFVVAKGGRMVERGLRSVDYPVRKLVVVQMGNDPDVTAALARVRAQPGFEKLRVVNGLGNLGCAAGWNRVILEDLNAEYWMILGFDISFPPGVLGQIHRQSTAIFQKHRRIGIVHFWYQWGGYKSEWSAFILRREVVHEIGFFDENVWPVNTEDYDYAVRMNGHYLREPWYRHLLPARPGCPSFYLEHGVADHGNSGTNHLVESAKRTAAGSCKTDALAYLAWQRRRSSLAYVSNKWGNRPGGGEVVQHQRCADGDPRYGIQPEEGRNRKFHKHPTGADYYPPVAVTSVFRDPYGHQHLPAWFWVLDPGTRRCIISGGDRRQQLLPNAPPQAGTTPGEVGQAALPALPHNLTQSRRRLKLRPIQFLDTEPCLGMRPSVPYTFEKLSGLPRNCSDALDLCISSLTSLQSTPLMEKLGLIPPLRHHGELCDRGGSIPLPAMVKHINGPCPAKQNDRRTKGSLPPTRNRNRKPPPPGAGGRH